MAVTTKHDALLAINDSPEARWNAGWSTGTAVTITYTFSRRSELPGIWDLPYSATGVFAFDEKQRASARAAFEEFGRAAGFHFVEVKNDAMIDLYRVEGSVYGGWADLPGVYDDYVSDVDIVVDGYGSFRPGAYEYQTLLHEIGHAVGLKHPHEGDPQLASSLDYPENTVMSYTPTFDSVEELGPLDKRALRELYGSAQNVDDWNYKQKGSTLVQDLSSRSDEILGIEGKNFIRGGGGNDRIFGRHDRDKLYGEDGDDRLLGDDGRDILRGGSGKDWLHGGANGDDLGGGNGSDKLWGAGGRDELKGGSGSDILKGGANTDMFIFTREDAGGKDTIVDFVLGVETADLSRTRFDWDDADIYERHGDAVAEFAGKHGFRIVFAGIEVDDLEAAFLIA